jgi:molybdate-binding protein/transcriptional regulator with XRE-family HTH domain
MSSGIRVRRFRLERGWSQQELADRSRVSRAEVSAIENARLSPSIAAGLALARALGRTVEEVFGVTREEAEPEWAFPPRTESGRFWEASVGSRRLLFPVEPTAIGVVPHDGVHRPGELERKSPGTLEDTVVIAGCDPAVGLLALELKRMGLRVLPLTRSSRDALSLLERGLVHAAGLHWGSDRGRDANAAVVSRSLGAGYSLLHLARWQEGVALSPSVRTRSMSVLARSRIRWVAREEGSGARRCLDRLLGPSRAAKRFRHVAADHRGVAQAIAGGWADAGVAVRLAAEEAGLGFLPVQQEDYDLCVADRFRSDGSVLALERALQSRAARSLRALYRELPGYDTRRMGEERGVV